MKRHSSITRWWLGLILWALAMCPRLRAQEPPRYISITNMAIHQWSLLYREFTTEFLLCLYGYERGDSILIQFGIPADLLPRHSLPAGIAKDVMAWCLSDHVFADSLHFVGRVHNHPWLGVRMNGERYRLPRHAQLCDQSPEDRNSFLDGTWPIEIIVCGFDRLLLVLRNGHRQECRYDPEQEAPLLVCEQRPMKDTP